jgi:hypothetical protein
VEDPPFYEQLIMYILYHTDISDMMKTWYRPPDLRTGKIRI